VSIDRAAIAAALSTVEGVTGYEWPPTTPRTGDAWPALISLERGPGLTFAATWGVHVALPSTAEDAARWAEARFSALVVALLPVAHVEGATMPAASARPPYLMTLGILAEG